ARLGITLTEDEQTRAQTLLDMATGLIRSEARQTISLVEDDVLTRTGSPGALLRLPQRPVVPVASITLDGEALAADTWYRVGDELVRTRGHWGQPQQELVITYDHGYDPVPQEVRVICLEAVVRVWVNPGSVSQEGYGSEQVSYPDAYGLLLLASEREVLRRAIGRGVGTVTLR
ncbi:MAG: hypothetical protein RJQ03_11520, partial [Miltoncostaeaceae bacterium]